MIIFMYIMLIFYVPETVVSDKLNDLKHKNVLNSFSFVLPQQNMENNTK